MESAEFDSTPPLKRLQCRDLESKSLTRDANIVFFWQTGYRFWRNDFKLVSGFTDLHENILLYKANNFM